MGKIFFFVGKHLEVTENQMHTWGMMGVFETEEEADKNCIDENYFYVSLMVGQKFPEEDRVFENIIYPREELNNG